MDRKTVIVMQEKTPRFSVGDLVFMDADYYGPQVFGVVIEVIENVDRDKHIYKFIYSVQWFDDDTVTRETGLDGLSRIKPQE